MGGQKDGDVAKSHQLYMELSALPGRTERLS
jgi:hypothetical protein